MSRRSAIGALPSLLLPLRYQVQPVCCSRSKPVISRQTTDMWSLLKTLGAAWKGHSTLLRLGLLVEAGHSVACQQQGRQIPSRARSCVQSSATSLQLGLRH